MSVRKTSPGFALAVATVWVCHAQAQQPFALEEASIADIHSAIKSGETSCAEVVQGYIDRARAYNGVCTTLVTEDVRVAFWPGIQGLAAQVYLRGRYGSDDLWPRSEQEIGSWG